MTLSIDHIQKFFLEMGRGFTFVGRQVHVVIGTKHFHIDLVLYNILLRCYVLIDLKIDELTHEVQEDGSFSFCANSEGE